MPSAKLVATNPSCKCYCTGGKRVSYPYGWATAASHHPSSSVGKLFKVQEFAYSFVLELLIMQTDCADRKAMEGLTLVAVAV